MPADLLRALFGNVTVPKDLIKDARARNHAFIHAAGA
jgi:hypothetical protein